MKVASISFSLILLDKFIIFLDVLFNTLIYCELSFLANSHSPAMILLSNSIDVLSLLRKPFDQRL